MHTIILDLIKDMFDQIAINDDQLYFEAIEKSVHDGKKPVPAPRRDLPIPAPRRRKRSLGNLNSDPMIPKPMKRTKFYCQEGQDDDKYDTAEHDLKKLSNQNEKMINCQVCDTEFDDHFELEKHFESAHDVKKSGDSGKTYENQNEILINCQVCGTEFDDHFELEKHFDSAHDVEKPSSHFEYENEVGTNFQPLSSSNLQNVDIIEEINDTLKGSDDSNAQTNEIKVKSANVKSPGIDTLKGSDDSNDQSNEIKVESVRNIIVDINHADSLDIHEFDFAKAEFVFDFESNEINLEENFKKQSAHEKKKTLCI